MSRPELHANEQNESNVSLDVESSDIETPPMTSSEEVTCEEVCGWIEFGCWSALAFTPMLYWVNGPAVSTDQLVMRWLVVAVAITGAVGLRLTRRYRGSCQMENR